MTMQPTNREKELGEIIMSKMKTDQINWDSGHDVIKPAMNDKLKEIRDKFEIIIDEVDKGKDCVILSPSTLSAIQSESYQLSRQEVIEEIEKLCQPSTPLCESNLGMESFKKVILAALDTLKSNQLKLTP